MKRKAWYERSGKQATNDWRQSAQQGALTAINKLNEIGFPLPRSAMLPEGNLLVVWAWQFSENHCLTMMVYRSQAMELRKNIRPEGWTNWDSTVEICEKPENIIESIRRLYPDEYPKYST
jgi:hypothetical protein